MCANKALDNPRGALVRQYNEAVAQWQLVSPTTGGYSRYSDRQDRLGAPQVFIGSLTANTSAITTPTPLPDENTDYSRYSQNLYYHAAVPDAYSAGSSPPQSVYFRSSDDDAASGATPQSTPAAKCDVVQRRECQDDDDRYGSKEAPLGAIFGPAVAPPALCLCLLTDGPHDRPCCALRCAACLVARRFFRYCQTWYITTARLLSAIHLTERSAESFAGSQSSTDGCAFEYVALGTPNARRTSQASAQLYCREQVIPYGATTIEVTVRSPADPYVLAGALTGCTYDFGLTAGEWARLATLLGGIIVIPVLGVALCCHFARQRKLAYYASSAGMVPTTIVSTAPVYAAAPVVAAPVAPAYAPGYAQPAAPAYATDAKGYF